VLPQLKQRLGSARQQKLIRNAGAQLAAMDILLHRDLIETVGLQGIKHIWPFTKIRLSYQGLQSRQQDWPKIVSAMAEGITEGVIKGLKK